MSDIIAKSSILSQYSHGLAIAMISYLDGDLVTLFREHDQLCKRRVLIFDNDQHMVVHHWTHQFTHEFKVIIKFTPILATGCQ